MESPENNLLQMTCWWYFCIVLKQQKTENQNFFIWNCENIALTFLSVKACGGKENSKTSVFRKRGQ